MSAVLDAINRVKADQSRGTLTLDTVRQLASNLSASGPASADIYAFYSGDYVAGVSGHQAAYSLYRQSPTRVAWIDATPRGQFLSEPVVMRAIERLPGGIEALFDGSTSLWGQASVEFAESARGPRNRSW